MRIQFTFQDKEGSFSFYRSYHWAADVFEIINDGYNSIRRARPTAKMVSAITQD